MSWLTQSVWCSVQVHAFTCPPPLRIVYFSWLRFVDVLLLFLHYISPCFLLDGSETDLWKMNRSLEMNHRSNMTHTPALLYKTHQHDLNKHTVYYRWHTSLYVSECIIAYCLSWMIAAVLAVPTTRKYYFELQMLIDQLINKTT